MKRDREGREAAPLAQHSQPPPPPPRVPSPNGTATANGGIVRTAAPASTTAALKVSRGKCSNEGGCESSASSAASKRSRFGLDPPEGWRAVADEILSRAGLAGGEVSVSTRAGGGNGKVGTGPVAGPAAASRKKFAAVCSANFNRSMMAHKLLQENRFHVQSFGTGRDVRLPGKDAHTPEVFAFGTPYRDIFDTLKNKDEEFFRRNNLLGLVARNAAIKAAPQRFQEIEGPDVEGFDVVLCFDSRVFYLVVEDLQSRDPETFKPLHVVNMTIKDSPEESAAAAGDVLDLCRMLDETSQLEKAAGVLEAFTKKTGRTILHQVCHV